MQLVKKQPVEEAALDLSQRDDRQLIAACLAGEADAWEALIYRYQRLIYSIPLKARLSPDDAADIFQSVSLKLFEKLATLRDHDKISSWLITTATRECWRLSARNRREAAPAGLCGEDDVDPIANIPATAPMADVERETLERGQAVRQAIDSLPERCRELVILLFYQADDWTYSEIAQRMNMPVPSIGPTRARCLEKLKKLLHGKI
ncbi:MAG TPA: sigma-70 family RNA polymerase sigma factor [Burkholderiales bacterium]|nr:sigma-70 family RNA polymerase sigma factor [Burkholderiales bacterium]